MNLTVLDVRLREISIALSDARRELPKNASMDAVKTRADTILRDRMACGENIPWPPVEASASAG